MSEKQHTEDDKNLPGRHKKAGGVEGGACLNRHVPKVERKNSCSHRWQAYQRAKEDTALYNWPAYQSLSKPGGRIRTAASVDKRGNRFPDWYDFTIAAPSQLNGAPGRGTWDLDHGDNFQVKCYRPYWHEANHIIPNSSLRKVMADVGKGMSNPGRIALAVRGRLLNAQYNLNHKVNMILLPMDAEVAEALQLPRHRQTAFLCSHKAYSDNVEAELKTLFDALVKEPIRNHTVPKYNDCKDGLEALSQRLYKAIVAAGKRGTAALDNMASKDFKQPASTTASKPPSKPGSGKRP
ncbi:AHH domain-containing protein [Myxococcus xanthus]|uniref:AHH domain-containing protein n=1 Tax=Myxococcus xanthus TaxID=34 RepID=UPI001376180A|nr:AHH domain-containing protein [Myxococcus xanthus]